MSVCVLVYHMCVGVHRGQKGVPDPLELELQVVIYLPRVPGQNSGSVKGQVHLTADPSPWSPYYNISHCRFPRKSCWHSLPVPTQTYQLCCLLPTSTACFRYRTARDCCSDSPLSRVYLDLFTGLWFSVPWFIPLLKGIHCMYECVTH